MWEKAGSDSYKLQALKRLAWMLLVAALAELDGVSKLNVEQSIRTDLGKTWKQPRL